MPASEFNAHRERHRDQNRERRQQRIPTRDWAKIRSQIIERDGMCVICGTVQNLEVHHIDGNWRNNDPLNLEVRCFDHNPRGTQQARSI